jgi:hypothetical protein
MLTPLVEPPGLRSQVFNFLRGNRNTTFNSHSWGGKYENSLQGSNAVWLGGTIGSASGDNGVSRPITPADFASSLISSVSCRARLKPNIYAFAYLIMNNSRRILTCFSEDLKMQDLNKAIEGIIEAVKSTEEGKEVYVMAGSDKLIALVEKCNENKELKELMLQKGVDLVFLHSMNCVNESYSDVPDVIDRVVEAPEFLKHQDEPNIYVQSSKMNGVSEGKISPFILADELVILPWNGIAPGFASIYDPYYIQLLDQKNEKIRRLVNEFEQKIGPKANSDEVAVLDATEIVPDYNDFINDLRAKNAKAVAITTCHSGSVCGVGDASIPELIKTVKAEFGIDCYGAPVNGQPATSRYPSGNAAIDAGLKMVNTFPELLVEKMLRYIHLGLNSNDLANRIYTPVADEMSA